MFQCFCFKFIKTICQLFFISYKSSLNLKNYNQIQGKVSCSYLNQINSFFILSIKIYYNKQIKKVNLLTFKKVELTTKCFSLQVSKSKMSHS